MICTDRDIGAGSCRDIGTGIGDVSMAYPVNSVLSASVSGVNSVRQFGHMQFLCFAFNKHET